MALFICDRTTELIVQFCFNQMDLVVVLGVVVVATTLICAFLKYKYSYWERKGFKTYPGLNWIVGNFGPVFTQKVHVTQYFADLYSSTTEPYVGLYGILRPMLLVRDPELIRNILVKDFSYFTDRGVYCDEKNDPISAHLFALPGERWKNLRTKLTPTFTTGKLKAMFSTLASCDEPVQNYLQNKLKNDELVDMRELAANITVNFITSIAFGVDADSINNPKSEFRECGRKIFESSFANGLRLGVMFIAPDLGKILPFKIADKDVYKFIHAVVNQNLKMREENSVTRKDFFQLLVQLRNKGTVQLDDQWETEIKQGEKKMTVDEMVAQTFIFFVAGFETSSQTISYCMYHLAKDQELQKKVHEHIDTVLEKYNGELTYESVLELTYLECCVDGNFFFLSFP